MNTIERIENKLEKERRTLAELEEKKEKIESKIKCCQKNIREYVMMIDQRRVTEVDSVITAKGLTLEEIMKAVQAGDLLSLQEKIEAQREEP